MGNEVGTAIGVNCVQKLTLDDISSQSDRGMILNESARTMTTDDSTININTTRLIPRETKPKATTPSPSLLSMPPEIPSNKPKTKNRAQSMIANTSKKASTTRSSHNYIFNRGLTNSTTTHTDAEQDDELDGAVSPTPKTTPSSDDDEYPTTTTIKFTKSTPNAMLNRRQSPSSDGTTTYLTYHDPITPDDGPLPKMELKESISNPTKRRMRKKRKHKNSLLPVPFNVLLSFSSIIHQFWSISVLISLDFC